MPVVGAKVSAFRDALESMIIVFVSSLQIPTVSGRSLQIPIVCRPHVVPPTFGQKVLPSITFECRNHCESAGWPSPGIDAYCLRQ